MELCGTPGRRAGASLLSSLAVGRQRFGAVVVLISRGPSSDPQAHDSPVTRVVWSEGVFLLLRRADAWESSGFGFLKRTHEIKTRSATQRR